MRKQGKSSLPPVAKDIIIVAIGVAIIWLGLRAAFGTNNPFYVVSSGSMEPRLEIFDVIVVQGNEPFSNVGKGDIIVFNRPAGHDRVIVHRVVEVIDKEPYTLRTKGDANPASIPGTDYPITKEEYIGTVTYVIPQVGYVTRVLTPPINYIIIAVIIGIMIYKQYEKSRSIRRENEKKQDKDENPEENALSGLDSYDKEYTQQNNTNDVHSTDISKADFDSDYSKPEHDKDHTQNKEDKQYTGFSQSPPSEYAKSDNAVVDKKSDSTDYDNDDNIKQDKEN